MAMIASVQISVEENQSWLGPRSQNIWAAATKVTSVPKPKKSKGFGLSCLLSLMNSHTPMKAKMPTGRLI